MNSASAEDAPVTTSEKNPSGKDSSGKNPSGNNPSEKQTSATESSEGSSDTEKAKAGPKKRWYVVHTYAGHENRARLSLLDRIRTSEHEELFGDVLIPTENVFEVVQGKRRTSTRKFYPSYLFVQMAMNEHSFHLVKNTPKVTGFLGGTNPSPVKESEIKQITSAMTEGQTALKPKVTFAVNDNVRVIDGPFANFNGVVEEVKADKRKLKVKVSIFGRPTPVELNYDQVERA